MSAGNIIDITDDGSPYAGRGASLTAHKASPPGNPSMCCVCKRDDCICGDIDLKRCRRCDKVFHRDLLVGGVRCRECERIVMETHSPPPYTTERLDPENVGEIAFSYSMSCLVLAGVFVLILGLSAGMVLARWIWS